MILPFLVKNSTSTSEKKHTKLIQLGAVYSYDFKLQIQIVLVGKFLAMVMVFVMKHWEHVIAIKITVVMIATVNNIS